MSSAIDTDVYSGSVQHLSETNPCPQLNSEQSSSTMHITMSVFQLEEHSFSIETLQKQSLQEALQT